MRSRFGAVTVTVAGSPEFQKSSLVMEMSTDSSLNRSLLRLRPHRMPLALSLCRPHQSRLIGDMLLTEADELVGVPSGLFDYDGRTLINMYPLRTLPALCSTHLQGQEIHDQRLDPLESELVSTPFDVDISCDISGIWYAISVIIIVLSDWYPVPIHHPLSDPGSAWYRIW